MELFFSFVIPTLNEEKYLPKILKDLSCQKIDSNIKFEVIIVDANSQDKTVDKAKEFADKFILRIYTVRKRNVSFQRNYGGKKAKGKYIFFLDADVRMNKTFVKKAYSSILKKKGLVFIPHLVPDENKPHYKTLFAFVNFWVEVSQYTHKPFSSGGVMIVEKHIFNLIGGFNEKIFIAEDHELIQRLFDWGVKATVLSNVRIKTCLRRMKKEGELVVLYKYLLATAHILFKGKIKNRIFLYKMGGDQYQLTKKDKDLLHNLKDSLSQFKKQFNDVLND